MTTVVIMRIRAMVMRPVARAAAAMISLRMMDTPITIIMRPIRTPTIRSVRKL